MMPLFWVIFWLVLFLPISGLEHCPIHESSGSNNESSLLESLHCYNNYIDSVSCEWTEHRNTALQLWYNDERKQCLPFGTPVQQESGRRTVQCSYNTTNLGYVMSNTVYFIEDKNPTLCSNVSRRLVELSKHLRARPPVNLSTHDAGDGGRLLSWQSPYPSSCSLSQNITYQLSYQEEEEENWKTEDVRNTSMKLEKLVLGRTYEARVRARVRVGQWSRWSTVVTWHMEDGVPPSPRLHCVLIGEAEVMCSWEVSKELADFITYQLAFGNSQTAPSKQCSVKPTANSDLVLKYSCSLNVTNPEKLQLELKPTYNAKVFKTSQHIRPNPPQNVVVKEKNGYWKVEWNPPRRKTYMELFYQACYYMTEDEGCPVLKNISDGSNTLIIPQNSLVPSHQYYVKVRALLLRNDLKGIPSVWTDPVTWTSHKGSVSRSTFIYVIISAFVVLLFFTLYCAIPACKRRVILWVDSIPSPGKSKSLFEIKTATSCNLTQREKTAVSKVLGLDTSSTCSFDASLCPNKSSEKKNSKQDEHCWMYDGSLFVVEEEEDSKISSMSFSGPYIFFKDVEPFCSSPYIKHEEEERKTLSDDSLSSPPADFTHHDDTYVTLPGLSASKSTQDLSSPTEPNTITRWPEEAEQADQRHADTTECPQPPAYTSEPVKGWPQGGAMHPSGYCHHPAAN